MRHHPNRCAVLAVALAALAASPALAQSLAEFYKDKQVTFYVGLSPGGGYDLNARLVAKHIGRYIPGQPQVIVRNMPGGGNVLATNYMYTQAPKDGTALGVVNNIIPLHQVLDGRGVRFDARKFN